MKPNFKKATLLLTGLLAGGRLLAQTPDTSHVSHPHWQIMLSHFAGDDVFRTWSIGVHAGISLT